RLATKFRPSSTRGTRSPTRTTIAIWLCVVAGLTVLPSPGRVPVQPLQTRWKHMSSANGDLPVPSESKEQTGAVVADLDKDGGNDFVLSFRQKAPALAWYRRNTRGWSRYVMNCGGELQFSLCFRYR